MAKHSLPVALVALLVFAGVYRGAAEKASLKKIEIKPERETYRFVGPGTPYDVTMKKGLGKVTASPSEGLIAGETFNLRIEYTAGEPLQPGDAFVTDIPYPWSPPTYIDKTLAVEGAGGRHSGKKQSNPGIEAVTQASSLLGRPARPYGRVGWIGHGQHGLPIRPGRGGFEFHRHFRPSGRRHADHPEER